MAGEGGGDFAMKDICSGSDTGTVALSVSRGFRVLLYNVPDLDFSRLNLDLEFD